MRDAGKPTPMTPPESSHTASRHTTGDPPQGGKSATHIGSDWDIPVEQDYPASAWDTSTDYGPTLPDHKHAWVRSLMKDWTVLHFCKLCGRSR